MYMISEIIPERIMTFFFLVMVDQAAEPNAQTSSQDKDKSLETIENGCNRFGFKGKKNIIANQTVILVTFAKTVFAKFDKGFHSISFYF